MQTAAFHQVFMWCLPIPGRNAKKPLLFIQEVSNHWAVPIVWLERDGVAGLSLTIRGLAVVLLALCAVAMFSIGLFYVPAALALLVAACTDARGQAADA